jgi:DNA polymerase I-like protein with 3'-5' exonuclease and polymerase domains
MHRDTAGDIWLLPQNDITSFLRYLAKNGWVFPQFYGSYYKNCAKDLWSRGINTVSKSGIIIADHLSSEGITDYRDFEDHCREVENIFWKRRFRIYDQWREEINEFYRQHGHIETFFGFQFRGYITKNEAANYPIQGTAFHVLLWILIKLAKWLRKEKLKSKIIGQIHDSIVVDLYPKEKEQIIHQLRYLSKEVRKVHDWIIIPIGIDIEISPINKSWYEKEKYGTAH